MKTIFLEQSYKDVNNYLQENIVSQKYDCWDYIVLTASNEIQAKNYELRIKQYTEQGFLDTRSKYIVVPDLNNERIGSGGATLNVLITLKTKFKVNFEEAKILLIHSGGDSKRIPQYSACGKLFSPVPKELAPNRGATLFNEIMAATSLIPSRMKSGVLVMSGDAELLFNPLQLEFKNYLVTAVSIKKDANIGANHGVFNINTQGILLDFLHKKSVNELYQKGAIDINHQINIDTGVIYFAGKIADMMLSLVEKNGDIDKKLVDIYLNSDVRLSFYGDFLFPFASNSNYESFITEPSEGVYSNKLVKCRENIWQLFNGITMNVICVSPADFLHFGTTAEMLNLVSKDIDKYKFLGWEKNVVSNVYNAQYATYNAVINNCNVKENAYIENSALTGCNVGNSVISNVVLNNKSIENNLVLSGLCLNNGKFVVRIYGIDDNPKNKINDNSLFGVNFSNFAKRHNIFIDNLTKDSTLWTTNLYPIANTMDKAVEYAINTYEMLLERNNSFIKAWINLEKVSLESSYNNVDIDWILKWNNNINNEIIEKKFFKALEHKENFNEIIKTFGNKTIINKLPEYIKQIEIYAPDIRMRLYLLSIMLKGKNLDEKNYHYKIFEIIKNEILDRSMPKLQKKLIKSVQISLPVRVNFAGGWTDTPPYCFENGGTVLNGAISFKGKNPISAIVEIIEENKIILASDDMEVCREFNQRNEILDCSNPFDRTALQKAVLVAMGIVNVDDKEDLSNVFSKLGGGLKLITNVDNIPKGSGLGTSSILACACVKAIYESMEAEYTIQDLSKRVLLVEQLMSTGGGWQDQIGGVVSGIKLITSMKGSQDLTIDVLELNDDIKDALNKRFAIIYTGQRRLARNLLRNIVFGYLSGDKDIANALDNIENLAMAMSRKLTRGDIDAFAKLMNLHWNYSKQIDKETSNTCIDFILTVCNDLIEGKMICGAGGGGFLQVILKDGVTKENLKNRLAQHFPNSDIMVYDTEFAY